MFTIEISHTQRWRGWRKSAPYYLAIPFDEMRTDTRRIARSYRTLQGVKDRLAQLKTKYPDREMRIVEAK